MMTAWKFAIFKNASDTQASCMVVAAGDSEDDAKIVAVKFASEFELHPEPGKITPCGLVSSSDEEKFQLADNEKVRMAWYNPEKTDN